MGGSPKIRQQEETLGDAMRRAQQGDGTAYRELLEAASGILTLYARRVLMRMGRHRPGAEDDLVQEVLLALHEKRHTYDPAQPFLPWLFAIARYKLIDHGRREKTRGVAIALDEIESALAAPVFADPATASDLDTAVAMLPEKSRRVLELVKLEGLSIAEAAARTQMSESAIKVTIHRALKTLRARFAREAGK